MIPESVWQDLDAYYVEPLYWDAGYAVGDLDVWGDSVEPSDAWTDIIEPTNTWS